MPDILLENIPDELFQKLAREAERRHRSIADEVLYLVEQALMKQEFRQAEHDEAIEYLRRRFPTRTHVDTSISELIREGREEE